MNSFEIKFNKFKREFYSSLNKLFIHCFLPLSLRPMKIDNTQTKKKNSSNFPTNHKRQNEDFLFYQNNNFNFN